MVILIALRMDGVLRRFKSRLTLPISTSVVIRDVKILNPIKYFADRPLLELYHVPAVSTHECEAVIQNITDFGFRPSIYGNKGVGVYLSSHSAYGLRWAGPRNGSLVCYVHCNPAKLKRFIAEIPPGYEYVADPDIVTPYCWIRYEITGKTGTQGFHQLGHFGCSECDKLNKRCDCPLNPTIYPSENIVQWTS